MSELLVLPSERHVELAAMNGAAAETRRRLRDRLALALLQNTRFASDVVRRVALAEELPQVLASEGVRVRGDAALQKTLDAIDDALRALREAGVDAGALGEVELGSRVPRARLLRRAMNVMDDRLARAGLVDDRLLPWRLGRAIAELHPEEVASVVGATRLRARLLLRWEEDRAWWMALATALRGAGGEAVVELPAIAHALDPERATDPFERVLDDVARALDEAPAVAPIAPMLGDQSLADEVTEAGRTRVTIRRALDAEAQARAIVGVVQEALAAGAPPERIAVALPRGADEAVTSALERTFDAAKVPLHFAHRRRVGGSLIDLAMQLLEVGPSGLARRPLAQLLRSRMLDASAITKMSDARAARAALADLADALDAAPTVEIDDALEQLVATVAAAPMRRGNVGALRDGRVALARKVGAILSRVNPVATRGAHVQAARSLFEAVGLAARAGTSVQATLARDDVMSAMAATELGAHARDARAKETLDMALTAIANAAMAIGANETCSAPTFRHELGRALEALGAGAAGRAFAVRSAPIEDFVGEPLECLVVAEVNEGSLTARRAAPALITPTLEDALRRRDPRTAMAGSALVAARASVALVLAAEHAAKVVLCYRTYDDDGAALAPTPLVAWLERGGVASRVVHSSPLLGEPVTSHERDLVLLWLDPRRAESLAPHAARASARDAEREAFHDGGRDATEVVGRLFPTLGNGDVARILELETGGGGRPLAVTALERVSRCAFQGFAAQVLGALDDDARRADTPDRREEGILVHEALGAAFAAVGDAWRERPRDRDAILAIAMPAADARLRSEGTPLRRVVLDRLRVEVERVVSLAIDDEEWDFYAAERGFGNSGDEWPALVVDRGGTRVALRGRIDRVDVAHDGSAAQVVDYKRRVSLPPIVELGEAAMQIPIYALAASRALGAARATGRYLSTVSPRPPSAGFERRLAELLSPPDEPHVLASALARVRSLREGHIDPTPRSPASCMRCGLDGACRRPRFAVTMYPSSEER